MFFYSVKLSTVAKNLIEFFIRKMLLECKLSSSLEWNGTGNGILYQGAESIISATTTSWGVQHDQEEC